MSHLRRGLALGSRGCTVPLRASLPHRSSAPGPNPTNSFYQQRWYNNQPLMRSSTWTLSMPLPGTGQPKLPGDAGSISRSSSTSISTSSNTSRRVSRRFPYLLPWIRPTRRYSPGSSSDGGASNRRRVGFLSDKNTTTYYLSCRRFAGRARDDLGLPNSASSSSGDGAALLRRVATYIEEDSRAAEKLGEALGKETVSRLSQTLDGMRCTVREPSWRELRIVAFVSGVPFVGFGMMDNAIMIAAGEYIDMTVGVALGISTMAAAALGNTISDVSGVGLGGVIESMATRLGLPPISLSRAQMHLRSTRTASLIGSAIGVTVGCLIGMFPLLLLPDGEVLEAAKRKEKIVSLIDAVVEEAASFLSATSATLFILDRETGTLWARRQGQPGTPGANDMQDLKLKLQDQGPVSRAARLGEAVSLPGPNRSKTSAGPSVLCMPVFGCDGKVAGVVQVVGKKNGDKALNSGFTAEDANDLSALCSHISVALDNINRTDGSDEVVDLRDSISLMRSYGGVNKQQRLPQHRSSSTPARKV